MWRARDQNLGREVAIKTLPEAFARDRERLSRFQREARLLATLNHPNIAAVHEFEEENGVHFLVLELVEGETLSGRLARGRISVEESLRLAIQICAAIEEAHRNGVIHRDLKPANIKITPSGKLKVLDFGLAKPVPRANDIALSNAPTAIIGPSELGTAAYMSPEQARGLEVDKRSDIWAFGCILFEMLSGKSAFGGGDVSSTLARVLERTPDFSVLPRTLHPRIVDLLEHCLEKDAENRLHDIADARIDIQRVLTNPGIVSGQPVSTSALNRRVFLAAAAGAGVTAAVAGAVGWKLKRDVAPSFSNHSPYVLPEGQTFTNSGASLLALSPDGTRMVYVADDRLYLRSMNSFESRPIAGTDGQGLLAPFFSPDGLQVGYWSSNQQNQLKRIAVAGGIPTVVATTSTYPLASPFWGKDDSIVWGDGADIMRVSLNRGSPQKLINVGADVERPQILPGNDAVLYSVGGKNGSVVVRSLKSDAPSRTLFPGTSPLYVSTGHIVYERDGTLYAVVFDLKSQSPVGDPVALVNNVRNDPAQYAVSNSGALIYVPRSDSPDGVLTWVDLKTREAVPLKLPPRPYRHPRLSPDGTRLAFQTTDANNDSQIWVYDLNGKSEAQPFHPEGSNSRPIWTRNGERLTFTSKRGMAESIWWKMADDSGRAEPLTQAEGNTSHQSDCWSPKDPRLLLFTAFAEGKGVQHVLTLSLDEKEPKEIAGGSIGEQCGGADFSSDGRWIAYRSNSGGTHIEMQPFPTTGSKYPMPSKKASYPLCVSNEKLIYRRNLERDNAGQRGELVMVDVYTSPNVRFGGEQSLTKNALAFFGFRDYDITAKWDRLIAIFPASESRGARPQINIIQNWFEELKTAMNRANGR